MPIGENTAKLAPVGVTFSDFFAKPAEKKDHSKSSFLYMGQEGAGKTTTALKHSTFWQSDVLQDAVLITYSFGGANCLASYGKHVDTIDIFKDMIERGITSLAVYESTFVWPLLTAAREQGKTLFVFDEITTRGTEELAQIEASTALTASGAQNKLDIWTQFTNRTQAFIARALTTPGVQIVATAHAKVFDPKVIGKDDGVAAAKKSFSNPTQAKFAIALPGQAGFKFQHAFDTVLWSDRRIDPKKGTKEYFVRHDATGGYPTKTRFEKFLPEGDYPADGGAINKLIVDGVEKEYTK